MKVLVCRVGLIGDTVMATLVVDALIERWGHQVRIDWLAKSGISSAVLRLDQRIGHVYNLAHRKLPLWLSPEKRSLKKKLQAAQYDLIINLELSAVIDDLLHGLCSDKNLIQLSQYPDSADAIHGVEQLQSKLNSAMPNPVMHWLQREPRLQWDFSACTSLTQTSVILQPGFSHLADAARDKHKPRTHRGWPQSHWVALAQALLQQGLRVIIEGVESERPYLAELLAVKGVSDHLQTPLLQTGHDLQHVACLVCVDSGLAHLAAALQCPVIALYGPTDARQTGPWRLQQKDVFILTAGLDCSPCYGSAAGKACKDNRCMQQIGVNQVLKTLHKTLSVAPE